MNETDRQLLMWAAKAAGIDAHVLEWGSFIQDDDGDYTKPWNPLIDDGDAFRLMVKCGFIFDTNGMNTRVGFPLISYAATRRAIVRAAAEIGRNMK